jgi:competence protein ComEC
VPLLWISLAFIAGLVLGAYLPWTSAGWLGAAALPLILWPGLRRLPPGKPLAAALRWTAYREPRLFLPPLLLLCALALGAFRMTLSGPDLNHGHVAAFNDQGAFRLTAVVDAPPDVRDQTTLYRLRAEQVAPLDAQGNPGPSQPVHGMVLALVPGRAAWTYGDRLSLDGKLVTPPEAEDFSYRAYLARQDVYTYLTYPRVHLLQSGVGNPLLAAIYRLRDWAYAEVFHLYPAPEAPLLAGILLGVDSEMPDRLAQAFRDTGTAHIIAISGFNIAILAQLFSKIFGRIFSRWWALLASIIAITGYSIMVGGAPSVARAAVMGSLALIAQAIGRRSSGANALALTAAVMCLPNPQLPWDVSFQLSFGATLGLVLYGDRLQEGFTRLLEQRVSSDLAQRITRPVSDYILMTLAAQWMTLPIILYHFKRLSLVSLIANPLILPPQPLVMVLSGVAVVAGAISDPLAHLLAWLAWPLSAYTNRMVEALASIPGGVLVPGDVTLPLVILMYAVVFAPLVYKPLPSAIKRVATPTALLVAAGLATAILWRGVAAAPDGKLRLVVNDLDGSQAMLILGPQGETLLINGGSSARQLKDNLDRWLSPFDRQIDGLLINSSQASAWNSLAGALDSHPAIHAWWGIPPPTSRSGKQLASALQAQGASLQSLAAGDRLSLGSQITLRALNGGEAGSALLLTWDNFRALIPAGTAPSRLAPGDLAGLSVVILDTRDLQETPSAAWLALAPQAIIATPGNAAQPPTGHNWLNTRPQSSLVVITDGRQMWLEQP